jgi:hypothetical protein
VTDQDYGVSHREWIVLARRLRLGTRPKGVMAWFASYANADGTEIHPGAAVLAVDAEVPYNYAADVISFMAEVGLIEQTRPANRRKGYSAEWRLILGPQLLDHVELLTEFDYRAAVARAAAVHGTNPAPGPGRLSVPSRTGGKHAASVPSGAGQEIGSVLSGTGQKVLGVAKISPVSDGTKPEFCPVPAQDLSCPGQDPPLTTPRPTNIHLSLVADLDADVTAPAREADHEDPISLSSPKCTHGLAGGTNPATGKPNCPLCRVGITLASAGSALTTPSGHWPTITGGQPA